MARKDCITFKVGDMISPLPHRKSSNDIQLKNLKVAVVTGIIPRSAYYSNAYTQELSLKVIEGYAEGWNVHGKKVSSVFNNAFQRSNYSESYEIF